MPHRGTKEHDNKRDKNVPPIGDRRGFLIPSKGFSGENSLF